MTTHPTVSCPACTRGGGAWRVDDDLIAHPGGYRCPLPMAGQRHPAASVDTVCPACTRPGRWAPSLGLVAHDDGDVCPVAQGSLVDTRWARRRPLRVTGKVAHRVAKEAA